jgi:hypothetical protein
MWGVGLIPTLIGIGLLMFVRLSKSFEPLEMSPQDSG